MHPRFAIAPINWTNDDDPSLGGDISLDLCLFEMKEAGYEGCELGNKFPKEEKALAQILSRYDLTLTTDWLGTNFTVSGAYNESLVHFRRRVEFLKLFGVRALKVCEVGHAVMQSSVPIFSHEIKFTNEQWKLLFKGLRDAASIARDAGMFIAYHHHLGTGIEKIDDIARLLENTDESDVSLLPDTGHLFAAGIDPLFIFKRYASRIKYIHLKDVREGILQDARLSRMSFMHAVRAGIFTVPSDGSIDFVPICAELKQRKYDGWLVIEAEQDPKLAPPLMFAKKARDFLRQNFSR